jgi:methoxymalonate biosynthesis protein
MGGNIATMAIGHGVPVVLVDVDRKALDAARARITRQLRHAQLMNALPDDRPAAELTTTTEVAAGAGSTVVVEAVVETPKTKAMVLGEVSATLPAGTPIISNTSGIPIDEMADWVTDPAQLVGTHFMNPTYLIKMVEVVRGPRTSEATMSAVLDLLTELNRRPIVVADAPGFVTSRLLHPMINAATRLVEAGTASVTAVDTLMEGCLGHPTGPLGTADLIGLDNLADSLNEIYRRTGDPSCRPSELLLEKVRAGHLGRKSGRGFYDYGREQA